jgi:uncharacterized membrane-anchored protein
MDWLKARLVDDWHRGWRWLSVQLNAFALLWMGLYALAPVLPPELVAVLPSPYRGPVMASYAVLGIFFRFIAQRKTNAS